MQQRGKEGCLKHWIASLLVVVCGVVHAQSTPPIALEHLSKVGMFAFGGVGFAGMTSEGEKDLRVLLSQPAPDALGSLETVYAQGTLAAKGYAVAGIRTLDEKRSKELIKPLESSQQRVLTMHGCIIESTTMAIIATSIDSGNYDTRLKPPDRPQ
jgi:hypothetical protein